MLQQRHFAFKIDDVIHSTKCPFIIKHRNRIPLFLESAYVYLNLHLNFIVYYTIYPPSIRIIIKTQKTSDPVIARPEADELYLKMR